MIVSVPNMRTVSLLNPSLSVLRRQSKALDCDGRFYGMDKTGFQIGITSTAKFISGFETNKSHAKACKPENREWVASIVAINATGWILPA